MKFWDNQVIIDAYFNQIVLSTEDERKLKERLRKKKLANRYGSFNRDVKIGSG